MGRKEILDLLAEKPGEFVSGESISRRLNLTRAAVWKQVQALKEAGYGIEGVTKSGYRLLSTPDDLDEWTLQNALKTRVLGRELHIFEELPSTNDWAKEAAQSGCRSGLTVIARRQNSGKGRQRRHFVSPRGGLWMTVVLQPRLSLADAAKLTLSAGVAAVEGIREAAGLETGIKWPNDIIYGGCKIAGILGEVAGEWTTVQSLVLGIGINVNFRRTELGEDLPANSLLEITGRKVDLNKLAARILENLERELEALEQGGFAGLRERWQQKALGLGEEVLIIQGQKSLNGIFRGINDDGELLLQSEERILNFSAGEVHLRAKHGEYFPSWP